MGDTHSWVLRYEAKPWLMNSERAGGKRGTGGRFGRAELVRTWRETFCRLAQHEKVPPLAYIDVEVFQACKDRRLPDTGACFPAVKAAIDGLVDADVLPDDGPAYVRRLVFLAPRALGYNALVLAVSGQVATHAERVRREELVQARLVRQVSQAR